MSDTYLHDANMQDTRADLANVAGFDSRRHAMIHDQKTRTTY